MKDHINLGKAGEEIAVKHLTSLGYEILDRNWRWGRQEIDIIARDGNFIVITEVKTRQSDFCADPGISVTRGKQRILVNAANAWVRFKKYNGEVRFDIITIMIRKDGAEISHLVDAFYATL